MGVELEVTTKDEFVPMLRSCASFGRHPPPLPQRFHAHDLSNVAYADVLEGADVLSQDSLDTAYKAMCDDVETELCYAYDAVDDLGGCDKHCKGRGETGQYIIKKSLIPDIEYEFGALSFNQLGLYKLVDALQNCNCSLRAMALV